MARVLSSTMNPDELLLTKYSWNKDKSVPVDFCCAEVMPFQDTQNKQDRKMSALNHWMKSALFIKQCVNG